MTEWGGTSTDIHELRGLQGRQQVLLSELQHRSRNLLTVVQGTAGQTARTTRSLEEFTSEFSGRLEALARAQSLIEETNHGMIELRAIVEAELAARGDGANATASGDPVELPPKSIQVLALALHELGTNAVKYGALREPGGELAVTWRLQDDRAKLRVASSGAKRRDPAGERCIQAKGLRNRADRTFAALRPPRRDAV
jgi:two-component sensor histidine kinase